MTGRNETMDTTATRCDVRVWSGACEHDVSADMSGKYLCDACGKISRLDHEVSHEGFFHMKGDDSLLC